MHRHPANAGLRRLSLRLAPDEHAPAHARRALQVLPLGARADDAMILASELVTNALLHSGSTEPIELVASWSPERLRVEVRDHGGGFGEAPREDGYGLRMLERASARWGVVEDTGTCVAPRTDPSRASPLAQLEPKQHLIVGPLRAGLLEAVALVEGDGAAVAPTGARAQHLHSGRPP